MESQHVAIAGADESAVVQWRQRLTQAASNAWSFVPARMQQPEQMGGCDAVILIPGDHVDSCSRMLGEIAGYATSIEREAPPVLLLVSADREESMLQIACGTPWDYRLLETATAGGILHALHRLVAQAHEREQCAVNLARLEARTADIEYLAHAVSHDIKAPLRIAGKFLELLKLRFDQKLDDTGREYVRLAVNNASKAQMMIDDLRAWSRIRWNDDSLIEVDLGELLREVIRERQSDLDRIGASVSMEALPAVTCNQEQLRRLFRQVIDNALVYHREEPLRISIRGDRDERRYIITVEDNGLGIEPEMCRFAYELFQRFHGELAPGNGSGLAYCKRIAEMHGGRTWLDSTPGIGTTFYLVLPVRHPIGAIP